MGRSSIIMVLVFSTVLMLKGFNLSSISSDALDNVIQYYNRAASHGVAAGIANMASQVVYRVPNSFPVYTNLLMMGGKASVTTFMAPVALYDSGKVMMIATSVYPYPLPTDPILLSRSRPYYDTVIIVWGQSSFSKFAYYSMNESGINWQTGDTVNGPFHTQDKMTISGSPDFFGKVTNKLGMTSGQTPRFHAGYQTGIDIPMPSSWSAVTVAAKTNGKYIRGKVVTIAFDSVNTGYMTIKIGTSAATRVKISTYCPNGALVVDSGSVHVKGIFSGQLTIASLKDTITGKGGSVWIDSSIVYQHDPTKVASSDLLGICADSAIVITENSNNGLGNNNGVTIQAALYSKDKGMWAQNYNDGNARGRIRLLGGISQNTRGAVGLVGGGSGYYKSYTYDERMMVASPPYFPATGSYEILSWYER
jgi:hypothetical protein